MNKRLIIQSIYISNFKAYKPCDFSGENINKISFQDMNDDYYKLMILSGFNGYGKTSIFQAVEFALSGEIDYIDYKDKNRKFEENIIINDLTKDSLVAVEFIDESTRCIYTVIRYAEKGKPGKYTDYAKGYKVYILESKFDYNKFIDMLKQKKIKAVTNSEIEQFLNEKNIIEWINENYIRQDFTSNIIFKKDSDRVNFINDFIELSDGKSIDKLNEEEECILEQKKELEKDIEEISKKIIEIKLIKAKEIHNEILNLEEKSLWDKDQYDDKEDFSSYIKKAESLKKFYIDLDKYTNRYKKEIVDYIIDNKGNIKYILLVAYPEAMRKSYIDGYNKNQYLKGLIKDKQSFLKTKINEQYLSSELIDTIEKIRRDDNELNMQSNKKETMYRKIKELRSEVEKNSDEFTNVFSEICPLCGHDYTLEENSLLDSINQYNSLFIKYDEILSENISILDKSIEERYLLLKANIEKDLKGSNYESEISSYIEKINGKNLRKFIEYKNEIEFILGNKIEISDKGIITNDFNSQYRDILNTLESLKASLDSKHTLFTSEGYDEIVYEENKKYCIKLNNIKDDNYKIKINNKLNYLQWRKYEKDSDILSKNKDDLKAKKDKYRKILIADKKVKKLMNAIQCAQKEYLNDIVKYIEIPLYIYSGKLIQTHQNGLGVFCYTGSEDDKLTQFKLTTNGRAMGHDIVNKFSSGQKAVINISIMLAFRKVINSNLDVFMIDDPCQSMDDINIASLTEILKNEFEDTQLIISTHEDNVAGYIKYKFDKSGKRARNFNVQKELYNTKIQ